MCLAGKDELHRHVRVVHDAGQTAEVAEEQQGPLVGGETSCETDGQDVGIEFAGHFHQVPRVVCTRGHAEPHAVLDERDGALAVLVEHAPDFFVRYVVDLVPETLVQLVRQEILRQVSGV